MPPPQSGDFDLTVRKRRASTSTSGEDEKGEGSHKSKKLKLDPEASQAAAGGEGTSAECEKRPSMSYTWFDAYMLTSRNHIRLSAILEKHFRGEDQGGDATGELKKCLETVLAFLGVQLDAIHEKLDLPKGSDGSYKDHRGKVKRAVKDLSKRSDSKAREVKERLRMLLVTFSLIGLRGDRNTRVNDEKPRRPKRNLSWESERDTRIAELEVINKQYEGKWRKSYWALFAGDLEQSFSVLEEAVEEREWMSVDRIDWENHQSGETSVIRSIST